MTWPLRVFLTPLVAWCSQMLMFKMRVKAKYRRQKKAKQKSSSSECQSCQKGYQSPGAFLRELAAWSAAQWGPAVARGSERPFLTKKEILIQKENRKCSVFHFNSRKNSNFIMNANAARGLEMKVAGSVCMFIRLHCVYCMQEEPAVP